MRTNKTNNSVRNLLSLTVIFAIICLIIFSFSFSLAKTTFAAKASQSGNVVDTGFEEGKFELQNEEGGFFNYVYNLKKNLVEGDLDFTSNESKFTVQNPGENEIGINRERSRGDPNLWGSLNYKIPDKIKAIMAKYQATGTFKYEISTRLSDVDSEKLYSTALSAVATSGKFSAGDFYVHDKKNGGQLDSTASQFSSQYGVDVAKVKRTAHKELSFNQERTLKQSDKVISAVFYEHTWSGYGWNAADKIYKNLNFKIVDLKIKLRIPDRISIGTPYLTQPGGQAANNDAGIQTSALKQNLNDYDFFSNSIDNISAQYPKIREDLEKHLDKLDFNDGGNTTVDMKSFTKDKISHDGVNDIYKWANFSFVDSVNFQNEGAKLGTDSASHGLASGLGKLAFGEEEINLAALSDGATGEKDILDGTELIAKVKYQKISNHQVKGNVYFYKNTSLEFRVFDKCNAQMKLKFNIAGIVENVVDPVNVTEETNEFTTDLSKLKAWIHGNSAFDVDAGLKDTQYNMYFYSLYRVDEGGTFTSDGENLTMADLKDKMPMAYGDLSKLAYKLNTGYLGDYEPVKSSGDTNKPGIYKIKLFTVSLAGAMAESVKTFYFKADSIKPETQIKKYYGESNTEIQKSDNDKWYNEKVILEAKIKRNMSGNYLWYQHEEGEVKVFFKNNKITKVVSYGETQENLDVDSVTVDRIKYNISVDGEYTILKMTYGDVKNVTNKYDNVDFKTNYNTYIGLDDEHSQPVWYTNEEWGTAPQHDISIRVDRTAPGEITYNDEENMVSEEYNSAKWYTADWLKEIIFNAGDPDELGSSRYKDVTFYLATTKEQVATNGVQTFDDNYKNISDSDVNSYFGRVARLKGSNVNDDMTVKAQLDLGDDSYGRRTLYYWVKDQAGNFSSLYKLYIKADPTKYILKSLFYRAGMNETDTYKPEMVFKNFEDEEVNEARRGEIIKVSYTLPSVFASNKVTSIFGVGAGTIDTLLLEQKEEHKKDNAFASDAVISSDISGLAATSFNYTMNGSDENKKLTEGAPGVGNEANTITFKYEYKRIVKYKLLSFSEEYAGKNLKIQTQIEEEDEEELERLQNLFKISEKIAYFKKDDIEVVGAPGVGTYKLHIDQEHATEEKYKNGYIIDKNEYDYVITKRNITVSVKDNLSKKYKEDFNLGDNKNVYKIENLVEEDNESFTNTGEISGMQGTLKLETTTAILDLTVGTYKIIEDARFEHPNYNITFVEGYLAVKPAEILVQPEEASKIYGDKDPVVNFKIEGHDNITDIIKNIEEVDAANHIYKGKDGANLLTRDAGENVGKYGYKSYTAIFDVDSNYIVKIKVDGNKFEIKKRKIKITPQADQEIKVRKEENITEDLIKGINVEYTLDNEQYHSQLAGILKVKYDATLSGTDREYEYELQMTDEVSKNFDVELQGSEKFKVKVIGEKVIVKNTAKLEYTYGDHIDIKYLRDKFMLDGVDLQDTDEVELNWDIESLDNKDVGNYKVTPTNVTLKINGTSHEVECDPFTVSIKQKELDINVTLVKDTKEYGEDDSVYGISHEEFQDKDGLPLTVNAGKLGRRINGSTAPVTKYDDITDENGNIYNRDNKYIVDVIEEFVLSNKNYKAVLRKETVLKIARKKLVIEDSQFIGRNKPFDSSSLYEINFPAESIYNLELVKVGEAYLYAAEATYVEVGTDNPSGEKGQKDILFKYVSLKGEKAYNYVLYRGSNEVTSSDVFRKSNVEIENLDTLTIGKSIIKVEKQYDGTKKVHSSDVHMIQKQMKHFDIEVLSETDFDDVKVGEKKSLTELKFRFSNIDASAINLVKEAGDDDIDVENVGNRWVVTVRNILGEIVKRLIKPTDLSYIVEGNKDENQISTRRYDATTKVDVNVDYAKGIFASGGIYKNLKMYFDAVADGKDVGEHNISIEGVQLSDPKNFDVDIEAFNKHFANKKITITKAQLKPEIIFRDRVQYNGTDEISYTLSKRDFDVDKKYSAYITGKVLAESDRELNAELLRELAKIRIDVEEDRTFVLTRNGIKDKNVQFDSEDKETYHHFIIRKMVIRQIDNDYANFMKNYELFGSNTYDLSGDSYTANGKVSDVDLSEGEKTVNNVEYLNQLILKRRIIAFDESALQGKERMFDGYNEYGRINAEVEYKDSSAIVDSEKDKLKLELVAVYKEKGVKRNSDGDIIEVDVAVKVLGLKNLDETEDYKKNYQLSIGEGSETFKFDGVHSEGAFRTKAKLLPAPLYIDNFEIRELEYTGSAKEKARSADGQYKYNIRGFIDNDPDKDDYDVEVNIAAYVDPNVENDSANNAIAKQGYVFNPKLTRKNGAVNYTIAYIDNTSSDIPYLEKNGDKYYLLKKAVKFLLKSKYNEADHKDKVLAEYVLNGNDGYLLKPSEDISDAIDILPVSYADAIGKITKKEIVLEGKIKTDSPMYDSEKTALYKYFDNKTDCNAVYKTDYEIETPHLQSTDVWDDSDINFTAVFKNSVVGESEIEVTAEFNGTVNQLSKNYKFPEKAFTLKGYIKQVQVIVRGADLTIQYNHSLQSEDLKNKYYLKVDTEVELKKIGKKLYMKYSDYKDKFSEPNVSDRFDIDGENTTQSDSGTYVQMWGEIRGINILSTTVSAGKSAVGSHAVYKMEVFTDDILRANTKVEYANGTNEGKIEIVKGVLHVAPIGSYTYEYASGNWDFDISLQFASKEDVSDNNGFTSADNAEKVFGAKYKELKKKIKFVKYKKDNSYEELNDRPRYVEDLMDGEMYQPLFPSEFENLVSDNYEVKIKDRKYWEGQGRLTVTQATLKLRPHKDMEYYFDGTNQAKKLLNLEEAPLKAGESDEITYRFMRVEGDHKEEVTIDGNAPLEVGNYEVEITLIRKFNDANGYTYKPIKLLNNPIEGLKAPKIRVKKVRLQYTHAEMNREYKYNMSALTLSGNELQFENDFNGTVKNEYFDTTFMKYDIASGEYVKDFETGSGNYVVKYQPKEDKRAFFERNFFSADIEYRFKVSKIRVFANLNGDFIYDQYTGELIQKSDFVSGKNTYVDYSIENIDDMDKLSTINLIYYRANKDKTKMRRTEVNTAGKYYFGFVSEDDREIKQNNFDVVYKINGQIYPFAIKDYVLELYTKEIKSANGDTVTAKGDSMLASDFIVKQLAKEGDIEGSSAYNMINKMFENNDINNVAKKVYRVEVKNGIAKADTEKLRYKIKADLKPGNKVYTYSNGILKEVKVKKEGKYLVFEDVDVEYFVITKPGMSGKKAMLVGITVGAVLLSVLIISVTVTAVLVSNKKRRIG